MTLSPDLNAGRPVALTTLCPHALEHGEERAVVCLPEPFERRLDHVVASRWDDHLVLDEPAGAVSACNSLGNPVHNLDQTITQFASGTSFAENVGSQKTFILEPSKKEWRDFSARITQADLESAINADRRNHPFSKKELEEAEKGERSWSEQGCGRSLSTNLANYALIGIEQGVEGGGLSEIGASDANLQLWTEYTPLPPTVTTEAATGVDAREATLHGTVNPRGTETKYHFEYGPTTSYGSSTPEGSAGSGSSAVSESATITGLEAGTTYHYRIVATSAGGEVKGGDQTFTTPVVPTDCAPAFIAPPGTSSAGNVSAFYTGTSGALYDEWLSASNNEWHLSNLGGSVAGSPSAFIAPPGTSSAGNVSVFYRGTSGALYDEWLSNEWHLSNLGGSVAGSPSAFIAPPGTSSAGNVSVFYRGTSGALYDEWLSNEWHLSNLGGSVAEEE